MTEERKADIEAKLAELRDEIALAIQQGAPILDEKFTWMETFLGRAIPGNPRNKSGAAEGWIAVLTVGKV